MCTFGGDPDGGGVGMDGGAIGVSTGNGSVAGTVSATGTAESSNDGSHGHGNVNAGSSKDAGDTGSRSDEGTGLTPGDFDFDFDMAPEQTDTPAPDTTPDAPASSTNYGGSLSNAPDSYYGNDSLAPGSQGSSGLTDTGEGYNASVAPDSSAQNILDNIAAIYANPDYINVEEFDASSLNDAGWEAMQDNISDGGAGRFSAGIGLGGPGMTEAQANEMASNPDSLASSEYAARFSPNANAALSAVSGVLGLANPAFGMASGLAGLIDPDNSMANPFSGKGALAGWLSENTPLGSVFDTIGGVSDSVTNGVDTALGGFPSAISEALANFEQSIEDGTLEAFNGLTSSLPSFEDFDLPTFDGNASGPSASFNEGYGEQDHLGTGVPETVAIALQTDDDESPDLDVDLGDLVNEHLAELEDYGQDTDPYTYTPPTQDTATSDPVQDQDNDVIEPDNSSDIIQQVADMFANINTANDFYSDDVVNNYQSDADALRQLALDNEVNAALPTMDRIDRLLSGQTDRLTREQEGIEAADAITTGQALASLNFDMSSPYSQGGTLDDIFRSIRVKDRNTGLERLVRARSA